MIPRARAAAGVVALFIAAGTPSRGVVGAGFSPPVRPAKAGPYTPAPTAASRGASSQAAGGIRTGPQNSQITLEAVILAADRVQADRWYPPRADRQETMTDDQRILQWALSVPFADYRRAAVRAIGRLETPANVPLLAIALEDPERAVRAEAANALVQSFVGQDPPDMSLAATARLALEAAMYRPENASLTRDIYIALAELPAEPATALKLERLFIQQLVQQTEARQEALDGLIELFRRAKGRPIEPATTKVLRDLLNRALPWGLREVRITDKIIFGPTAKFVEALQLARDDDPNWPVAAANFDCADSRLINPNSALPECGIEIRRTGVEMLNPQNLRHRLALEEISRVSIKQLESLKNLAIDKLAKLSADEDAPCRLMELAALVGTTESMVDAAGKLKTECAGGPSTLEWLRDLADRLRDDLQQAAWHLPVRALVALAQRDPEGARLINTEAAVKHAAWQVRLRAAGLAGLLRQEPVAMALVDDEHANVRQGALVALKAVDSAALGAAALRALESTDDQLVRTAAMVLTAPQDRTAAITALLQSLERLTKEGRDTTREPRLAILDRLAALMRADDDDISINLSTLSARLVDLDPKVAVRAAELLEGLTGARHVAKPTRRPPLQPTEEELRKTPPCVTIDVESRGMIYIKLETDDAPIAAARFVALARARHYDGLTFHQVAPDVIQGGSPGANDFVGAPRYLRDEIGARQTTHAVSLATHGRDTADGRFFINTLPRRHLDREATVFGHALPVPGWPAMPTILEGDRIKQIVEAGPPGSEQPRQPCAPPQVRRRSPLP